VKRDQKLPQCGSLVKFLKPIVWYESRFNSTFCDPSTEGALSVLLEMFERPWCEGQTETIADDYDGDVVQLTGLFLIEGSPKRIGFCIDDIKIIHSQLEPS
jgi:hypothetical protein